jgi:hypothetical protein
VVADTSDPAGGCSKRVFYRALVEAKAKAQGWQLPKTSRSSSSGTRGRQAEFRTRVHGNGNLLIGHAYTRQLGLVPGQEFRIELQKDSGIILLLQLDQDQPFDANQAADKSAAGLE